MIFDPVIAAAATLRVASVSLNADGHCSCLLAGTPWWQSVDHALAHLLVCHKLSLVAACEHVQSRAPDAVFPPASGHALVRLEWEEHGVVSDLRIFGDGLPREWRFTKFRQRLGGALHTTLACHGTLVHARALRTSPRMARITQLISSNEAAAIIAVADPALHMSRVVAHERLGGGVSGSGGERGPGAEVDAEARSSWSCKVEVTHTAVRHVLQRVCALLNLDPLQAEAAQVVRYRPGEQYSAHFDWFEPTGQYFADSVRDVGNRLVTVFAYLRAPEDGGHTAFPTLALVWWNLTADGQPDPRTLHTGCPVEAGTKYGMNMWFRERPRTTR